MWRNPDKEFLVIPVAFNDYFDDVDCSNYEGEAFERGLYYDGMACETGNIGDKFCVCFKWNGDLADASYFSKACGKCRDPNDLILA